MDCAASSTAKPPNRATVVTPQVSTRNFSCSLPPLGCWPLCCLNGAFAKFTPTALFAPLTGACFLPAAIADGPATTNARPTAVDRRRFVLFMYGYSPFERWFVVDVRPLGTPHHVCLCPT